MSSAPRTPVDPSVTAEEPGAALAAAEAALAAGEWSRAGAAFTALVDTAGPRALEGIAQAAWWLDDGVTCLAAREEAHRRHREAGDLLGAARTATALGYDAALFGQGAAVARGWLGRARELLTAVAPPTPEHGWLAVREAELALQVTHRLDVAVPAATSAVELGRALGRADVELVGLGLLGLADVLAGRLEEGMERLDTAVVGCLAGDVEDLMWVGKVCCWLVVACREAQDLPRALEWCDRVDALCRTRDLAPLFTACRIQYASVRLASGHWAEAEDELLTALDRMRESQRSTRTDAVVLLGDLRRRQGRDAEAEELYAQAGYTPAAVVGRALLRLSHGDAAGAWALAAGVLDDVPTDDRLARARILLPVVRCAVAAEQGGPAAAAAEELAAIAEAVGTEAVRGTASVAAALLAEPADAPAAWRTAARCFHRAGLPLDEAEARVELARCLVDDAPGAAVEEARAATEALSSLQAPLRLAEARAVLARVEAPPAGRSEVLTPRELEVLSHIAAGRGNAAIARALVVSEHTVHRHVANILARLGEPTRAAAVARAAREGLL